MKQYVGYVNFSGNVAVYFEADENATDRELDKAAMEAFDALAPEDISYNVSVAECVDVEDAADMEETL